MTRIVRVTYEDGTHEDVNLREAAFGLDGTALHGPVVSATLASGPWDDLDTEDPNLGRRSNLLERSARPLPIYGTGRNREAA